MSGNSRSNDKGKNFYYQKIMGSCVSEGVQAWLKARALLGHESPAQRGCHGNWLTENSVVYLPQAIDALKTGMGQHLGWNELMQQYRYFACR